MLSGRALVLRGQIDEALWQYRSRIPLGTGRGIAFVVFFAADADNIVGPGINGVVGRVSVQTQVDGAGRQLILACFVQRKAGRMRHPPAWKCPLPACPGSRSGRRHTDCRYPALPSALCSCMVVQMDVPQPPDLMVNRVRASAGRVTVSRASGASGDYLPVIWHLKIQGGVPIFIRSALERGMGEVVELEGGVYVRGKGRVGDKDHGAVV